MTPETREGTPSQAGLLLLGSCLPVLGAVLIAPLLPLIKAAFSNTPGVDILVPLALAAPALSIALISPFAGALADRWGRKRLLITILPLYALAGLAPLMLQSLHLIVASRFILGAAEAVIMTICTTLIGDYFHGARRERMLAFQTIATSTAAIVFVILGGALGGASWRAPFWLYGVGFVFAPLAALLLWEPLRQGQAERRLNTSFPWSRLAPLYGYTLLMAVGFYVVPSQSGFLLSAAGVVDPTIIGLVNAAAQASIFAAAVSFRLLRRKLSYRIINATGFAMSAAGLLALGAAGQLPSIIAAAVVNGIGLGLLLPGLVSWVITLLDLEHRGRGAGGFTSAFFLGQFLSPLVVAGIAASGAQLGGAVSIIGLCTMAGAGLLLATSSKPDNAT